MISVLGSNMYGRKKERIRVFKHVGREVLYQSGDAS